MAITQISRIQHRTGNLADLTQLATGELGFATDAKKLFIGDDPATTNTEILTEYSIAGVFNITPNYVEVLIPIVLPNYTVSTLPAPATLGMKAIVTDATATTFASIVAGGGANIVPVFYNGTNWIIG